MRAKSRRAAKIDSGAQYTWRVEPASAAFMLEQLTTNASSSDRLNSRPCVAMVEDEDEDGAPVVTVAVVVGNSWQARPVRLEGPIASAMAASWAPNASCS